MTWTVHIVGYTSEETLQRLVSEFVAALEGSGHSLSQAVLNTDNAQTFLALTPPPDPPVAAPVLIPEEDMEEETGAPIDTPPTLAVSSAS